MTRTNDGIREHYDGIVFVMPDGLWTLLVQTATARAVEDGGYEFVANLKLDGDGSGISNVGIRVMRPDSWTRESVCVHLCQRLAAGELRPGHGFHFS